MLLSTVLFMCAGACFGTGIGIGATYLVPRWSEEAVDATLGWALMGAGTLLLVAAVAVAR
jgi:hypothetical protein